MKYIALITNNFDSDYVAKPFATEEEAIAYLRKDAEEEIKITEYERGYKPVIKEYSDIEFELLYSDTEYYDTYVDKIFYRVIEIGHNS